ncbi:MAG: SapC family protein, partial [Novosphingobium sp.]
NEQPFIYRGFQMINQEKLREMRGDVLRGWAQSGLLPLLYAHLFSLELISQVFGAQVQLGKGPIPAITLPA